MRKYILLLCLGVIFYSCSVKQVKTNHYEGKYFVIRDIIKGDSIDHESTSEYIANVEFNGLICNWNKVFIQHDLESTESLNRYYLVDSIQFGFLLNQKFEILRILKWKELYNRVKKETDELLNSTPESKRESLKKIINELSLDSTAIVNKNTQEAQYFNLALQFLFDEKSIKNEQIKIYKEQGYRRLIFEEKNIVALPANLKKMIKSQESYSDNIEYTMYIEIVKKIDTFKIQDLTFIISFLDDKGIRVYTRTVMSLRD